MSSGILNNDERLLFEYNLIDDVDGLKIGKNITIADLAIWRLLGWLTSGFLDGVPMNILEPYKRLKKLREEIYNHPKVNEWMMKTYGKII